MDNINNITINERDDIILNDNIMKVLMTRQLNQIYPESTKTIEFKKYLEELILFNKKMTSISTDDAFWELSLSYLYYLNNQIIESEFTLNSINNFTGKQELQRDIIRDLNYLNSRERFNDDDEDYLGSLLFKVSEKFNDYFSYNYYNNAQSHFYSIIKNDISKKSTKPFYKEVFSGRGLDPVNYLYNSDLKNINKLLSNIRNIQNSTLKEFVLQNNYENIILERKGTLLMRNPDSLEKAIDIFESLPDNFINNYHRFLVKNDPFIAKIRDCIGMWDDCNENSRGSNWNKLTLSKELLNIRSEAYQNNNPENYFLLATAYYNMSYFGSSWRALSHYRTTTKIHGFYNMQIPINLYEKTIKFSNDDELIAKSLFMTSKCERNNFLIENNIDYHYIFHPKDYRKEMNRETGYRKNFYKLQRYRHTRFFDEAFRECYDFSYYSNNY